MHYTLVLASLDVVLSVEQLGGLLNLPMAGLAANVNIQMRTDDISSHHNLHTRLTQSMRQILPFVITKRCVIAANLYKIIDQQCKTSLSDPVNLAIRRNPKSMDNPSLAVATFGDRLPELPA